MPHIRRIFHVPPALEDLFVADLWEEGTLGVVSTAEPDGRLRLEAWFDQGSPAWEPGGWAERGVRFSGGGPGGGEGGRGGRARARGAAPGGGPGGWGGGRGAFLGRGPGDRAGLDRRLAGAGAAVRH